MKDRQHLFNLIIIGDEILHGSRQDKHFAFFKSLLESRGLKLSQVQYRREIGRASCRERV